MNALKNLSLILLLSLAFTGCHNKSSKINDFNLLLYAPEYASGFDIKDCIVPFLSAFPLGCSSTVHRIAQTVGDYETPL